MAKLSGLCPRCLDIRNLVDEGRRAQACKLAAEHLRAGAPDRECQALAADLLDPPQKYAASRPIQSGPRGWVEIAARVEELQEAKHRCPVKQAAKEFKCSRGHVRNAMKVMKAAREAAGEN
jgi:hypothetical protein